MVCLRAGLLGRSVAERMGANMGTKMPAGVVAVRSVVSVLAVTEVMAGVAIVAVESLMLLKGLGREGSTVGWLKTLAVQCPGHSL